ncbi:MAG TPA: hypothetical protein VM409_00940 [Chloroflexia bacterium]|nr:hypothetical protein [Chloroflexia bacterium]
MNRRSFHYLLLISALALVFTACDSSAPPGPTATLVPTVPGTMIEPSQVPTPPPIETNTPAGLTSTPGTSPVPSATSSNGGRIIYLDSDGTTVKSVRSDGTESEILFNIPKGSNEYVTSLSTDPAGNYLLYGLSSEAYTFISRYYVVRNGKARALEGIELSTEPRWSPDGTRLAAQSYGDNLDPGAMYVYEPGSATLKLLGPPGKPDWYPDGEKLVFVNNDNVFSLDLTTQSTEQLTKLPNDEDGDAWVVQEAHVLPASDRIVFFGGEFKKGGELQLGASGNGQQWWLVPVTGGEPQPWLEPGGNSITGFEVSPGGQRAAFVDSAHYNACAGVETLTVVDTASREPQPLLPPVPEIDEAQENFGFINNLAWEPGGSRLAFGVVPYRCPDAGAEWNLGKPVINLWSGASGQESGSTVKLLDGSYPNWTR